MFEKHFGLEEVEPEVSHGKTKAFGRTYESLSKIVATSDGKLLLQLTEKQPGSSNTFHIPYEEPYASYFRIGLEEFLSTEKNEKRRVPIGLPLKVIMTPLLLCFGARMKCGIPSLSLDLPSDERLVGILTLIGKEKFLMLRLKSKYRQASGVFSQASIVDFIEKRLDQKVDPVDGINSVPLRSTT